MQEIPPSQQMTHEQRKYQRAMEKMFDQINVHLHHLFTNLSYVYQTHGIFYNLSNFHGFILRMVIPPELYSFIHFWCPNGDFKDKAMHLLDISQPSEKYFFKENR